MKKKEKGIQIDGQLSIFDVLNIPADIDKTYSSGEIKAVVLQLLDAQKRAEKREKEEKKIQAGIIILTDGEVPFPKESVAMDIPVLWLLNNEKVNPPWWKVARIVVEAD